jgi:hypothetical protein
MANYLVRVNGFDDEYYETEQEAKEAYEGVKIDLMSDGHEPGSQITLYELKPLKTVTSVVDHERMKVNHPKDEGYEWDSWAKWEESI